MTSERLAEPGAVHLPTARIDWIDRLRIWLTILVVAHHSADTYSSLGDWYVVFGGKDASATLLTLFMLVNQLYFMGAFFLLAGFFTPGAYDRRGPGRYVRDRLVRLGIPFLFYVVVIRPLCILPSGIAKLWQANAAHRDFSLLRYVAFTGDTGVAWFLEVLIVFSLGYVLLRVIWARGGGRTPVPRTPRLGAAGLVVVVLAAVTFVWQWAVPLGAYWPVAGLPSPYFLPQYVLFFVLGAMASRREWLQRLPGWWAYPAVVATVAGGLLVALSLGKRVDAGHPMTSAAQAGGAALFGVGVVILLIVVFRRWFARPGGRTTRMLSGQSFLVYVIHPLVLTWIAVLLMGLHWPSIAWAALLFVIGVPVCWGLAWLLRRIPSVRRVI